MWWIVGILALLGVAVCWWLVMRAVMRRPNLNYTPPPIDDGGYSP